MELTRKNWLYIFYNNKQHYNSEKKLTTILDKTTWENVFINAHYLTQQNYSQINGFMRKETPLPQFKVASYKCLGIRLSFEDPTTLLPGGEGREEWVGYEV